MYVDLHDKAFPLSTQAERRGPGGRLRAAFTRAVRGETVTTHFKLLVPPAQKSLLFLILVNRRVERQAADLAWLAAAAGLAAVRRRR